MSCILSPLKIYVERSKICFFVCCVKYFVQEEFICCRARKRWKGFLSMTNPWKIGILVETSSLTAFLGCEQRVHSCFVDEHRLLTNTHTHVNDQ